MYVHKNNEQNYPFVDLNYWLKHLHTGSVDLTIKVQWKYLKLKTAVECIFIKYPKKILKQF